ncbi:acetylglutamate kinase [Secundilactobacillus kimchicus]|uniref:Acetylglutamate kinase n=1 Tax=Secundilactobacillus kimchicus JCM 15530 TaxID=1302272 RepID=A0A0R1HVP0_9LACO|nr:acetylglutamate kinase [Secundilactobacillus kimchicus]KRK47386.1 acetylglutamate kinase [Secundilactobacillus kimchicus JCM 15530]MBT9672283.1 acetylglutamate kinase [Secundilactobacillus kimchicus]
MGLIIVKIGGNAIDQLTANFFDQLRTWRQQHHQVLLIHGGGPQISALSQQLGLTVEKRNGLRVTDAAMLDLTKMVLLGVTQPKLLTKLAQAHIPALGLNAADQRLLTGDWVNQARYGHVGHVTGINQPVLQDLLTNQIGVLAPLAMTATGQWLNVNADDAAAVVAQKLQAERLYLLTDVAGVLQEGAVIHQLTPQKVAMLMSNNVIKSGMQPKLKAAVAAIRSGVKTVHITNQLTVNGTVLTQEAE